ncbi:MAG: TetR/AcrR family transcriptional regulator [Actinomycetota bacterium]|nr:TetR/AcrR family transcriptional regulator [Actinomycetota bacterium]
MKNTAVETRAISIDFYLKDIRPPKLVLSKQKETELSERQQNLLSGLGKLFNEGFAHLTMAEIAKNLNCSLRTLYSLAPSKEQLVLIVIERNLWSKGRTAMAAISPNMQPLKAIRTYLQAANMAAAKTTEAFAQDLQKMPAAQKLIEDHNSYLIAITHRLLDIAVEKGEIGEVDTAAIARLMAGIGRDFSRPGVIGSLRSSPKEAADEALELILAGLAAQKNNRKQSI